MLENQFPALKAKRPPLSQMAERAVVTLEKREICLLRSVQLKRLPSSDIHWDGNLGERIIQWMHPKYEARHRETIAILPAEVTQKHTQ